MIGKTISILAHRKFLVYTLFTVLTIVTLLLTLLPPDNLQGRSLVQYDKLGHFLMFFGWSFMLGFALIIDSKKPAPLFFIFVAGSMFGISIEVIQEFLPYGRSASYADAIADVIGSLSAVLFLKWIKTRYQHYLYPSKRKK